MSVFLFEPSRAHYTTALHLLNHGSIGSIRHALFKKCLFQNLLRVPTLLNVSMAWAESNVSSSPLFFFPLFTLDWFAQT